MTNATSFPSTERAAGDALGHALPAAPHDETADARERREFTTSLGALMLGQLAHAIAVWRSERSRPAPADGNTAGAGRVRSDLLVGTALSSGGVGGGRDSSAASPGYDGSAVRASAPEIGGPVAGRAPRTTCEACSLPLTRSRYGWIHDAHGDAEVLRTLACPLWAQASCER